MCIPSLTRSCARARRLLGSACRIEAAGCSHIASHVNMRPASTRLPLLCAPRPSESTDHSSHSIPITAQFVVDEGENLRSTTEQRLYTYGSLGMLAAVLARAASQVRLDVYLARYELNANLL
jgi:hypothetical protein